MSILVVGSLHLDVVLNAPHLPELDETVTGHNVAYVFGGKGGNQAIAAARMGGHVHFAGRAGQDSFGDMIRETFAQTSVDTAQLQLDPGASGMSAAIVNDAGDYGAVIVSAANLRIEAEKITIPDGCRVVLLQNEIPEAVNLSVARKASAAGAKVWLNAAPARDLSADFVAYVDLLIANRGEAAFYCDLPDTLDRMVTLGAEGVSYQGKAHKGHKVDVVSTHGAGDAFVGALAACVSGGRCIADSIGFAQAAAALHVSLPVEDRAGMDHHAVTRFADAYDSR